MYPLQSDALPFVFLYLFSFRTAATALLQELRSGTYAYVKSDKTLPIGIKLLYAAPQVCSNIKLKFNFIL